MRDPRRAHNRRIVVEVEVLAVQARLGVMQI